MARQRFHYRTDVLGASLLTLLTLGFWLDSQLRPADVDRLAHNTMLLVINLSLTAWAMVLLKWQYAPQIIVVFVSFLIGWYAPPFHSIIDIPLVLLIGPALAATVGLQWIIIAVIMEITVLLLLHASRPISLEAIVVFVIIIGLMTLLRIRLSQSQMHNDIYQREISVQSQLLDAVQQTIIVSDLMGSVTYINPYTERNLHFSDQKNINIKDILFDGESITVEDLIENVTYGRIQSGKFSVRSKDGSKKVPVWATALPIHQNNKMIGISIIMEDISDQTAAEAAIRSRDELFRLICDSSQEMIAILDAVSFYLYISPACILLIGYPPEELLGTPARSIMHPDDYPLARQDFLRLIEGIPEVVTRYRVRHKNSKWVWLETRSRRAIYRGNPVIVSSSRNITADIRLETDQQHLARVENIGTLLASIGHDIRNKLFGISMHLNSIYLASKDPQRKETVSSNIEKVIDYVDQTIRMAEKIGDFTKRREDSPQIISPNKLIEDLKPWMLAIAHNQFKIVLNLHCRGMIRIDPIIFQQICTNLVANAHDAMIQGGILTIETKDYQDNSVGILIIDTGEGIEEHVLPHIFEPFYTTKTDRGLLGGTGVGLTTVRDLVTSYGGEIFVSSKVGEGSTFTIRLPRFEQTSSIAPAAADLLDVTYVPQGTVILVEDDPYVCEVVAYALSQNGYRVLQADTPAEALAILSATPDTCLMITDQMLGGQRGSELAEQVRSAYPQIQVIIMSSYRDMKTTFPFIAKPFKIQDLLRLVQSLLERKDKPS